ncbi:anaphase-promoting complex subunit 5-like [Ptychodera flava]|uniref:anaphase-promoting complex subunit 5-like n=1 Tax=Ptychodera flava TaxID=63121 RepID=UPI00396A54D8
MKMADLFGNKQGEWVTPHKISLLMLVKVYVDSETGQCGKHGVLVQRKFAYAMLKWIQNPDVELKELMPEVQEISEDIHKNLNDRLDEVYANGLSTLIDFFQSLDKLLESIDGEPVIHRSSIIGIFVRRMILAFDKLSFSQISKLYKLMRQYYLNKVDADMDELRNGDSNLTTEDLKDEKGDPPSAKNYKFLSGGIFSQKQAEYFIAHQAGMLHSHENQALSPKELNRQICQLLRGNPDLAEAHYLSYLNNLRINEFCNTIHELYRYSDKHAFSDNTEAVGHSFRYAALNLAGVHCRFGHMEEALAALKEAISMAQEANDSVCLQHAAGWLCRLQQEKGEDLGYLLDRSVTKARELSLPYLASLGIQNYTKQKCRAGADPASMFSYFLGSDAMNLLHNMPDLMCTCLAMQSAMWQMYGQSEMSRLCSQMLLHMNNSSELAKSSFPVDIEAVCIVLCHLAKLHSDQGYYNAALDVINYMKKTFPSHSQHSKLWMLVEQQIAFTRSIHHAKWSAAEQAILNITALDEVEALYRKCQLLRLKGETSQAYKLLHSMLDDYHDRKKGYTAEHYARLLITLAELCCQTSNYTLAASHLLQGLSLCQQHHFYYLGAMTTMHLAHVQLQLNLPHQALSLVEKCMIQVLAHGSLYDKCCVKLLLSKCNLASTPPDQPRNRKFALLSAVRILVEVSHDLQKTEALCKLKEVYYLQARIFNELGDQNERNKSAFLFRQLDQQFPSSVSPSLSTL